MLTVLAGTKGSLDCLKFWQEETLRLSREDRGAAQVGVKEEEVEHDGDDNGSAT